MREQPGARRPAWPGRFDLATAGGQLASMVWPAAILVAVLYFNPRSARVFEPDKWAWLILLALLGLAGLSLRALGSRPDPRALIEGWLHPLPLAGTAFSASLVLSSWLAPQSQVALWGAYRRGQGLWAGLALLLLFAAARATGSGDEAGTRWSRAVALATVPAALYALLQRLGIDSLHWDIYGSGPSERAFGPLGNPIFLGAWLAMAAPICLAALAAARADRRAGRSASIGPPLAYGLAFVLAVAGLLASQSRGPLLGMATGLVLLALLAALCGARVRRASGALAAAALALLALVALAGAGLPGLGRLADLLDPDSRTFRARQAVWEAMAELARAEPARWLTGYGPDNLSYVLPRQLPDAAIQLAPEQYFDRAHNLLWETWSTAGLLGLASLLLLHWAAFDRGLRRLGLLFGRPDRSALAASMIIGTGLGWLLPAVGGRPALAAPAAMAGLLAGALVAAAWLAARRARQRRAGHAAPSIDAGGWLTLGILSSIGAHWVEAMVGLPTAAGDGLLWIGFGLLAAGPARPEAAAGGSRIAKPDETARRRATSEGLVEGLAVATVLMAPLLLPSPEASLAAWPLWLLLPATWIQADLAAAGRAHAGRRRIARAAGPLALALLLAMIGKQPAAEIHVYGLTLIGSLMIGSLRVGSRLGAGQHGSPPGAEGRPPRGRALPLVLALSISTLLLAAGYLLALRPMRADVWARRGQEHLARAEISDSIEALQRARDLWHQQAVYLALLASAHEARLRQPDLAADERRAGFEAARSALDRAFDMAPDDYLALRSGDLLRARGDAASTAAEAESWWRMAAEHYAAALELHPKQPRALLEQAALHERMGEIQWAASGYRRALELDPTLLRAAAGLLRAGLQDGGDFDTATERLDWILARGVDREALLASLAGAPERPDWRASQARAHILLSIRAGWYDAAEAQIEALAKASPDDPWLDALEGWLADRRGRGGRLPACPLAAVDGSVGRQA